MTEEIKNEMTPPAQQSTGNNKNRIKEIEQKQSKWIFTSMASLVDNEKMVCLPALEYTFVSVVMAFGLAILSVAMGIQYFLVLRKNSLRSEYVSILSI